ncbi:MAG: cbb3-type cytochrome c oxidase subunit I [Nitrospinota bacterium]
MRTTYSGKWFALSIICLGIGGSFALLVGLSRAPFISDFLPKDYFQHALVGHVTFAILFWLMLSAVVLWSYHFKGRDLNWSIWSAIVGTVFVALSALSASGEAYLNNYVPTIFDPMFFIGLAAMFIAFVINVFHYTPEAVKGVSSDDMVTNGLSTAVLIALILAASVAVSLVRLGGDLDVFMPQVFFERLFWIPGHIQQFLNGAMLVSVWYLLAEITTGDKLRSYGFLKFANKVLIFSTGFLLAVSFFFDPLERSMRVGSEIIYAFGLGVPLFLHIINISRQFRFDRKRPASVSLVISMTLYLYGIFIAYGGFNNDTRVPAHYHGAVTALTLALMGFAYHMISGYKIRVALPRLALAQPYAYGIGMLLFITGLFVSGIFGAPRKTFGVGWTENSAVIASLGLMGIGTLLAVIGGAIFVVYSGLTLIKEEKLDG